MNTKQYWIDNFKNIATALDITDERAFDDNLISFWLDGGRATIIVADYKENKIIRREWLTDLGMVDFWRVNFADDPFITYCKCDISKAFVPKVVSITGEGGNPDLGINAVMSSCGTKSYYQKAINIWKDIPKEHIYTKFNWYDRIDTVMYVNRQVEGLRILAVLETPEDGYINKSKPVASGDLIAGTTYVVKYKQITYNFITLAPQDTFIAQAGLTTYLGAGSVYPATSLAELTRKESYPLSIDLMRKVMIDVFAKEFNIAMNRMTDVLNDSQDDEVKAKSIQAG